MSVARLSVAIPIGNQPTGTQIGPGDCPCRGAGAAVVMGIAALNPSYGQFVAGSFFNG